MDLDKEQTIIFIQEKIAVVKSVIQKYDTNSIFYERSTAKIQQYYSCIAILKRSVLK